MAAAFAPTSCSSGLVPESKRNGVFPSEDVLCRWAMVKVKMFFRLAKPVFLLFDVCNNGSYVISGMGLA